MLERETLAETAETAEKRSPRAAAGLDRETIPLISRGGNDERRGQTDGRIIRLDEIRGVGGRGVPPVPSQMRLIPTTLPNNHRNAAPVLKALPYYRNLSAVRLIKRITAFC